MFPLSKVHLWSVLKHQRARPLSFLLPYCYLWTVALSLPSKEDRIKTVSPSLVNKLTGKDFKVILSLP